MCGKPLHYDKCILARLKLGYVRILVELNAIGDFLKYIIYRMKMGMCFTNGSL